MAAAGVGPRAVRLTYASRRAWPARGGIERYLQLFASVLAAEQEIQVLTQQVSDEEHGHLRELFLGARFEAFSDGGIRTEPLRLNAPERARALPLVARALAYQVPGLRLHDRFERYGAVLGACLARRADRPDLLHVMNGGNFAAAGVQAARRLGVPLVVTPQAHPGQWDDDEPSGIAYRAADLVIASGEADAAVYRRLGVGAERVAIVPPCTAPPPPGRGADVRTAHRINGPLVLFLGVRRAYKGHDLLLRAAPAVARQVPGTTFAFVGPGAPLPPAPPAVSVVDVGPVSEVEKAAWLDAADVVALPSAYESFGLVVAEAWSLGTPVVTSRAPALAELVEAAGGGLAVERDPTALADALVRVLGDPALARSLADAGRRHWQAHHTPERAAQCLLERYRELVAGSSTRSVVVSRESSLPG